MAFDFYSAYVLSADDFPPQVALGCKQYTSEGRESPSIKMLFTGGAQPVRKVDSTAIRDYGDTIEVDNTEHGHFWKFQKLTLKLWHELGEGGYLVGYDKISDDFSSDADLQQFYVQNFLQTVPWYEEETQKLD